MKMRTWSIILLLVVAFVAAACADQPAEEGLDTPETEPVEPNTPMVDTTAVDTLTNDTTGM